MLLVMNHELRKLHLEVQITILIDEIEIVAVICRA